MHPDENEEKLLRSVALQTARAVMHARERAERELRESESRKSAILNVSLDAIITMDHMGRIADFNPAAERIFGYSRDAVIGQPLAELIIPERYRTPHYDGLARYLSTGHGPVLGQRMEMPALHAEGHEFPAELSICRIAGIEPPLFTATVRDITERKLGELKRDRLTSVLERSLNEIYMFDTDHLRFQYVNEGARRNLGYSMDEMRELTPLDLKPEFSEADFRTMVTPLLSGEQEKHVYYTVHRRKNGTLYPVEVHLQSVAHQAERVFLAVTLDITERKNSEENLRRSEEELRALANSIPQLAWMAHADGNIFWYNDRWFEYTGTTLPQMEGWGWHSVHDPDILPSVLVRWNSSITTGEPFEMEFPLRSGTGEFRWFLTRMNPVRNSEGTVVRWFGTNTDVDEVRRAREELEQRVLDRTASLQETTQQLEAFCYTIAARLAVASSRAAKFRAAAVGRLSTHPGRSRSWLRATHHQCRPTNG